MKNKRSADRLGWKVEWIKEGGEEMVKSLDISSKRIKTKKVKCQNSVSGQKRKVFRKVELKRTIKRIKEGYFW